MKASELINKLQVMIDEYEDKDVSIIAGSFWGEIADEFTIVDGHKYYKDEFYYPHTYQHEVDNYFYIEGVE